jgi:predicted N-acyltransferase
VTIVPTAAVEEHAAAADVPAGEWDALLTVDDFFLSARWLRVAEATAGAPMRYLTLRRGGRLVAGLATALADASAGWVLGRPDTMLEAAAASGAPDAAAVLASLPSSGALLPTLVCGGRHMGRSRVLPAGGAEPGDVDALLDRAERIAEESSAGAIGFPFVEETDGALTAALERRGYVSWVSGNFATLRLPEPGFAAYVARFASARRKKVLRERARLVDAGVTVSTRALDPALFPRFAELEAGLYRKYGIDVAASEVVGQLEQLLAVFGDDAVAVVAECAGEVRGFAVMLPFRDQWYARNAGFDYEWQRDLPLYFEVAYYAVVEAAERAGVTGIHYGLGSEEAKRSRGCVTTTQRCFVRPLRSSAP